MLESCTLAEQLKRGPLPVEAALRYTIDVATVLCDLHEAGCVHGGVHPSNIALSAVGATLTSADPNAVSNFTPEGDIAGLGVTLFEMLTGDPPDPAVPNPPTPSPAGGSPPEKLRDAALDLARRCMATNALSSPDIRRVRIEARVLLLGARKRKEPALNGDPSPQGSLAPAPAKAAPPKASEPTIAPELTTALDREAQPTLAAAIAPAPGPPPRSRGKHHLQVIDTDCPRCHASPVFASRARTRFEEALERLDFPVCRCHNCGYRFLKIAGLRVGKAAFAS